MTIIPLSLQGVKALFCHCEPECLSIQAWQSLFVITQASVSSPLIKKEIATAFLTESLAMTEGLSLPRLPFGRLDSMGIGFLIRYLSAPLLWDHQNSPKL